MEYEQLNLTDSKISISICNLNKYSKYLNENKQNITLLNSNISKYIMRTF